MTPLPATPTQSIYHTEPHYILNVTCGIYTAEFATDLPWHWSVERETALYDQMALYDWTYVFSVLHSIFQYVIKVVVVWTAAKQKWRTQKLIMGFAYE